MHSIQPLYLQFMNVSEHQKAARLFAGIRNYEDLFVENEPAISTLQGGLINHSYKVLVKNKAPFLLQQINHHVFKTPDDVQSNYLQLWNFTKQQEVALQLPEPLFISDQQTLHHSKEGNTWRAFKFIEKTESYKVAHWPDQAYSTAQTFAKFTAAFSGFDSSTLKTTIPKFHNLSFRYSEFDTALQFASADRLQQAGDLIKAITERIHYKNFFDQLQDKPALFKKRVMHHDAKIANVLFEEESGNVVCAVDFDTVMPGYYFSDLGDMIRSMSCNEDETSVYFDKIAIRKDFYEAIVSGYLSVMQEELTKEEVEAIHHSGIIMIYMQAIRFLADYLNKDQYYRITYPDQNLHRAKNQLLLLQSLEQLLEDEYSYSIKPSVLA